MAFTIYNEDHEPMAGDKNLEPLKSMCNLIEGGYILDDVTEAKVYPLDPED